MILIVLYASFSLCSHPESPPPPPCPQHSSGQRGGRAILGTAQIGTETRTPCARERSALPPSHNSRPEPPGCPTAVAALASLSPGLPLPQRHHCALESGDGAWDFPRPLQPCGPVPMPRRFPRSLGTHLLSGAGPWQR